MYFITDRQVVFFWYIGYYFSGIFHVGTNPKTVTPVNQDSQGSDFNIREDSENDFNCLD